MVIIAEQQEAIICRPGQRICFSIHIFYAGLTFLDVGFTPQPFGTDWPGVAIESPSGHNIGRQLKNLNSPRWATFHVTGDEAKEGPIYNYARVLTWWKFSTVIEASFEALIINLKGQKNCRNEDWIDGPSPEINLSGTASDVSKFCGLDRINLDAYSKWEDIGSNVWHQIAIAAAVAMWVQWGTTGKQKFAPEISEVGIMVEKAQQF